MIDGTMNAVANAPQNDPRAASGGARDDGKSGSFGDALSTVRDERQPQAHHAGNAQQQETASAEEQGAHAQGSGAEKTDMPVRRPAFLHVIGKETSEEGASREAVADLQRNPKMPRASSDADRTGRKPKGDSEKRIEPDADGIDVKVAIPQTVTGNMDIAPVRTPLEEIAQAIASKVEPDTSEKVDSARERAEPVMKAMPHASERTGKETDAGADSEGDASPFRFSSSRPGTVRALDISVAERDGRVEFDARESAGKPVDTIAVLDSRRFIGLAPSSNASALTGLIASDSDWVSAMQPGSSLSNAATQSSTGRVVHTLKLHMTPIDLGSVTMSLRLAGEELAVHMTVESVAAYRKLQDDSKSILEGLRAQGLTVDNITISIASSDKSDQTGTQGNNQQNQNGQQQGQQAASGRNRDESGARSGGQGNGDILGVHNEGMDRAPGSSGSSADNGVYL